MVHTSTIDDAQLPPGPGLEQTLSPAERERLAGLRTPKRRQDWLRGRYAAKRLVQGYLAQTYGAEIALDAIAIVSAPDGAPEVIVHPAMRSRPEGTSASLSISISHSADRAFCALREGGPIGADIERVERRGPAFAADYCTPEELAWLAAAPAADYDMLLTAIWSAKEAALKALHLGLTVDTRDLTCLPARAPATDWQPVTIRTALSAAPLQGWWRAEGGFVFTLAC